MPSYPDELLMAYADGELSPEEARAFEARLAADPALRQRLEPFTSTSASLSGLFDRALTEAGVSREQAYEWAQRNAMRAWDEGGDFREYVLADADMTSKLSRERVERVFAPGTYLRNVDAVFARVFGKEGER